MYGHLYFGYDTHTDGISGRGLTIAVFCRSFQIRPLCACVNSQMNRNVFFFADGWCSFYKRWKVGLTYIRKPVTEWPQAGTSMRVFGESIDRILNEPNSAPKCNHTFLSLELVVPVYNNYFQLRARLQIRDQEMPYFFTFQVVGWADVFSRKIYRDFKEFSGWIKWRNGYQLNIDLRYSC